MDMNKRVINIIIFLMVIAMHASAVTVNGVESTDFILDYATVSVEPVQCATEKELYEAFRTKVKNECVLHSNELGTDVEYKLYNAMFSNYVSSYYICDGEFYWDVGNHSVPISDGRSEDEFDKYMVPAFYDMFKVREGYSMDDVVVTLITADEKFIGSYHLMNYINTQMDAPRKSGSSTEDLPGELLMCGEPREESGSVIFPITVVLGRFNPDNWNLSAVTNIRYRVTNADYIPYRTSGVSQPTDDESVDKRYYDLYGMEVSTPQKGSFYIVRQGSQSQKIRF